VNNRLLTVALIGASVGVNIAELIPERKTRKRTIHDRTRIEMAEQKREKRNKRRMKP
jgi:uncharacterized membrane protein YsdA (DUF1294 family)